MKILFLSDNFPPEVNALANRTYEHCLDWAKAGEDVEVVTCFPNFPQGKLYPGYKKSLYQREVMHGIKVLRVWSYFAANRGFVRRVLDYVTASLSAAFAALFLPADVIIASSPQWLSAVFGWVAAALKRKPFVFEVRDLWPDSIRAVGAIKSEWILRLLEKLENFLYKHSTAIVAVTESFKEHITSRGIDPSKIHIVKNGVRLDFFTPRPKDEELLRTLGVQDKFVVAYIGTHGMAHALSFILRCAARLKYERRLHFLLIGDGAEKPSLLAMKNELNLDNVTMLAPVAHGEVPRYISICDVALINLRRSPTFLTVLPSKIFENAAMRKPILLGVDGEARRLMEQYGAGLYFEPENEQAFEAQLMRLLTNRELYSTCADGGLKLAKDFERSRWAAEMLAVLRSVGKQ